MKTNSTTAQTVRRNQTMILVMFLSIGLLFVIYGIVTESTSIIIGGVIALLNGFFFFGLPRLLRK